MLIFVWIFFFQLFCTCTMQGSWLIFSTTLVGYPNVNLLSVFSSRAWSWAAATESKDPANISNQKKSISPVNNRGIAPRYWSINKEKCCWLPSMQEKSQLKKRRPSHWQSDGRKWVNQSSTVLNLSQYGMNTA